MNWFGKKGKARRKLSAEERAQKKEEAKRLALYAAFSSSTQPPTQNGVVGKSSGFDISTQQKIAAYNLLMNDKE
ncbi:MAG: hypothetical protein IJ206_00120 [Oscillospiraceae bacterium]|nr:hypothetical protein [Oscillospiraceae bacterium]